MPSSSSWFRRWRWWLLTPLLALTLLLVLAALAIDRSPRVSATTSTDANAVLHLRQWLRAHDPRRARDGRLYVLQASGDDLQWLAEQAARLAGGAARVTLREGQLQLRFSLPWRRFWLNAVLDLGDGATRPVLQRAQLGQLVLPGALAEPLLALALRGLDPPQGDWPGWHQVLQGTRWQADRALVVYRWRADIPGRVADWLVPAPQLARLRAYHDALNQAVRAQPGAAELPALLEPLFRLAQARSAAGGETTDAAAENRAALLVLAAYVTGRPLQALLPAARGWPALPRRAVLLDGRPDFPLHFMVSAALAAEGSGPLSDALGLVKEVSDARQGSGFSFNDIAVNRAGTRLGQQAVRAPRQVQAALAGPVQLLPDVSDLPEFMPEAQFLARYGGVGAPAYRAMLADIEARVAALPLYR